MNKGEGFAIYPSVLGKIKIGYTDKEDYEERIKEQTHVTGLKYKILFSVSAMRSCVKPFAAITSPTVFFKLSLSNATCALTSSL